MTRLETRTKESTCGASSRVWRPKGAVKATTFDCGGAARAAPHTQPAGLVLPARLRESGARGTRKMVSYARGGSSQRKLWWRLVAVLTCKSIVTSGYRGERLIEPFSSWFPPKFSSE